MARLNELPAPAESIEALKRRFIRQNREIARVNSIQSLRIQHLEAEVSHLLSENASLREQVIALSHDAGSSDCGNVLSTEIETLREELSTKVEELGALVEALGELPRKGRIVRSKIVVESKKDGSFSAQPRRPISKLDWVDDDGTKLPIILEHKPLTDTTAWSPDFAVAEVAASTTPASVLNLSPDVDAPTEYLDELQVFNDRKVSQEEQTHAENQESTSSPPLTVDTAAVDILSHNDMKLLRPTQTANKPNLFTKPGSKRKFAATDEGIPPQASLTEDEFEFRRLVKAPDKGIVNTSHANTESTEADGFHEQSSLSKDSRKSSRKILQPKSTNISSISPRKGQVTEKGGYRETAEPTLQKPKLVRNMRKSSSSRTGLSETETMTKGKTSVLKIQLEKDEETDASQLSPIQIHRCDTSSSQHDDDEIPMHSVTSANSRPTRRPRGPISYAEPNLRNKMRRPTKDFVDAVGADRFRRDSFDESCNATSPIRHSTGLQLSKHERLVALSTTKADDDSRQTSPKNELDILNVSSLPTTIITERKRRTLSAGINDIQRTQPVKHTIAATESSESPHKVGIETNKSHSEESMLNQSLSHPLESLDISATRNARHSRRHSSQSDFGIFTGNRPKQGRKISNQIARPADDTDTQDVESNAYGVESRESGERISTRRRSMMV